MRVQSPRTVALLIESGRAYGRGVLRGVARYARTHGHWSVCYHLWELDDAVPPWLARVHCDGVIARIVAPAMLTTLRRLKVPVVEVSRLYSGPHRFLVGNDDRRTVQLAVEHLQEKGFRQLAYCGFSGVSYSITRRDYFLANLAGWPSPPLIYEGTPPPNTGLSRREAVTMLHERQLGAWLAGLPKPIGVLACNDIRGRQVLNACLVRGIAVPDQVAVIGVDDDKVLCELADPPLSSVIPDTERIGYEAAALLEALLSDRRTPPGERAIEPLGVAARASTDVLAVQDRRLAAALRHIREHACEGLTVEALLDHLADEDWSRLSNSTLERLFAQELGRSPKAEIIRIQLRKAQQLLTDTDWKLAKIARAVGVAHVEHFCAMFKGKLGLAPGAYRRQRRFQ